MAIVVRQTTTNTTTAVPVLQMAGAEGPITVVVRNNDGTNAAWLGAAGVTATTGLNLPANTTLPPLQLGSGDDLYALAAAGTPVIQVLTRT